MKDLKATGQMIQKLQEGWQSIHNENLENFEKSRVILQNQLEFPT